MTCLSDGTWSDSTGCQADCGSALADEVGYAMIAGEGGSVCTNLLGKDSGQVWVDNGGDGCKDYHLNQWCLPLDKFLR